MRSWVTDMKKIFAFILSMASLLCGCEKSTSAENTVGTVIADATESKIISEGQMQKKPQPHKGKYDYRQKIFT